jgi:hypothetical protein
MTTLNDQLTGLSGKPITVWLIGGNECSGTLISVGEDYIELDQGGGQPHWLIPVASISCISHRV